MNRYKVQLESEYISSLSNFDINFSTSSTIKENFIEDAPWVDETWVAPTPE